MVWISALILGVLVGAIANKEKELRKSKVPIPIKTQSNSDNS